ncbi:RNA polymerase sigma-70 factor [Yinghuangia seranimata]|uniref:RNA polymerase sigma-70 factor n=1 Tax=Yinghuangia seranimata TaxID=408067 RepID=UPI00248BD976|nr:RNA polymerase sigma-70 factor [Yinghuangia seranimata]MDI2132371.1 RNA polymerase sigma-70 factor [Yinghuangia seranimata]
MTDTLAGTAARPGAAPAGEAYDEAFEQHRTVLLGLAYRMLGSWFDAEDTVQEAWLRWRRAEPGTVEDPRGWLVTVTTRLALDQLRSARHRRETYVGEWLPEPVPSGRLAGDPAETAEQRATVSLAALRMMERLSPPERAVYLLREAFELPYQDIADVLGINATYARQLHRRAGDHLDGERARFTVDTAEHRSLVDRFVTAAATGDRSGLESLLARNVVLWSDGGGKARATLNPIYGPEKIARFLFGIQRRARTFTWHAVDVNGAPALLADLGAQRLVMSIETSGGNIVGIQAVANPDKISHIPTPPHALCFPGASERFPD